MNPGTFELHDHLRPWGRRWTFVLKAPNGEVILTSEPYSSRRAALRGMQAIRRYAPNATGPDRNRE